MSRGPRPPHCHWSDGRFTLTGATTHSHTHRYIGNNHGTSVNWLAGLGGSSGKEAGRWNKSTYLSDGFLLEVFFFINSLSLSPSLSHFIFIGSAGWTFLKGFVEDSAKKKLNFPRASEREWAKMQKKCTVNPLCMMEGFSGV